MRCGGVGDSVGGASVGVGGATVGAVVGITVGSTVATTFSTTYFQPLYFQLLPLSEFAGLLMADVLLAAVLQLVDWPLWMLLRGIGVTVATSVGVCVATGVAIGNSVGGASTTADAD